METDGVWIENVKREPDDVIVTDYEIRKEAPVNALTDFGRVYIRLIIFKLIFFQFKS